MDASESYPVDGRNRLTRRPDRAAYDKASVFDILDSALIAHITYVIDGQPFCTPTAYWRHENRLYWHGSIASRMTRFQAPGVPVCVTVTHLDAVVLARSARHHSLNYRSVMAFASARLIEEPAAKRALINEFIDRIVPGRAATLRPPTNHDVKSTSFISIEIDQASAKTRSLHVNDDESDFSLPIWAARIPVRQVIGDLEICPRQVPGVPKPDAMATYQSGRSLDAALLEAGRPSPLRNS